MALLGNKNFCSLIRRMCIKYCKVIIINEEILLGNKITS